jgi:hypothetical protein
MRYFFRVSALLCALTAVLETVFWAIDRWQDLPFHQGWLLLGSVVWGAVFWSLSRWRKIPD